MIQKEKYIDFTKTRRYIERKINELTMYDIRQDTT